MDAVKSCTAPREATVAGSFFQEALSAQPPARLVRVTVDGRANRFPKISGHKNHVSIRFTDTGDTERPVPWHEDTSFTLTCCVF